MKKRHCMTIALSLALLGQIYGNMGVEASRDKHLKHQPHHHHPQQAHRSDHIRNEDHDLPPLPPRRAHKGPEQDLPDHLRDPYEDDPFKPVNVLRGEFAAQILPDEEWNHAEDDSTEAFEQEHLGQDEQGREEDDEGTVQGIEADEGEYEDLDFTLSMAVVGDQQADSILHPISVAPVSPLYRAEEHPIHPQRMRAADRKGPLPTNKFYGNLMLGDSHAPIWTHPYGLRWERPLQGEESGGRFGLSISHIDDDMKAFGPDMDYSSNHAVGIAAHSQDGEEQETKRRSKYYLNPFLVSLGISAVELDAGHEMTLGGLGEFGCMMELSPAEERQAGRLENPMKVIRMPLVRGMAFVTALYKDLTPRFYSQILVRTLTWEKQQTVSTTRSKVEAEGIEGAIKGEDKARAGTGDGDEDDDDDDDDDDDESTDGREPGPDEGTGEWIKYRVQLENGVSWLIYARTNSPHDPPLQLKLKGQGQIVATSGRFTGLIQVAKIPLGNAEAEALYDQSAGVYATSGELKIRRKYVNSKAAGYRIDWNLEGDTDQPFIHYALQHHRAIMTARTQPTGLSLPTTTKGLMIAYKGASWHLREPERLEVGFLPKNWSKIVTKEHLKAIRAQAEKDVDLDFSQATNLDSMYFAGKGLAKFGLLCLVITDVLKDEGAMRDKCMRKYKDAFSRFLENRQMFPLVYDTTWKGLISVQGIVHGALADFGNTWYNDHHYHYGYFVHAAAILRKLDSEWEPIRLTSFVETLLRDVANPSKADPHFPVFRSFDWFMGHSWSQGIFVSLDGKDEESTSEDINLYYAMSLWAQVQSQQEQLGQEERLTLYQDMNRLAEVMLTVARRSVQSYFLMEKENENHPERFVGNFVTGILFENKVDHTTYFSPRIECIQGIQMIPATPALPLIRKKEFVRQEWEGLLQSRVNEIEDGWKSILMMNLAMIDKAHAWEYFNHRPGSGSKVEEVPLDDGMTKTWALFYVASMAE